MVIDLKAEREKREARRALRHANPSIARDCFELAVAGAIVMGALWVAIWILGPQEWKS